MTDIIFCNAEFFVGYVENYLRTLEFCSCYENGYQQVDTTTKALRYFIPTSNAFSHIVLTTNENCF